MSDTLGQTRRTTGVLSYLSLFTSFGTLLCCALPSLLVLLGLGATVASFLSAVPWLVMLSRHKTWVFAISGFLIAGNLLYVYAVAPRLQVQGAACPANAPHACTSASRFSRIVLWVSATIYGIGVFSAYVLGPLLMRFG
jgi:mercuric ion transport protein